MAIDEDSTHWVYVISKMLADGPTGPVKIGITGYPEKRLSALQTACPFPIQFFYKFPCPSRDIARYIELSFHETRPDKRLHGEWFNYEPGHALAILCIAFHFALKHQIDDPEFVDEFLNSCGVRDAERLLGLPHLCPPLNGASNE